MVVTTVSVYDASCRGECFAWLCALRKTIALYILGPALFDVVEHVLAHDVPGGAYTPAKLIGADLVTRLPDSGPMQIA